MLTIYGPPAVTLTIKTKPPIGVCKATNLALKSDFGCTWCSSLTTSQKIGGKAFLRGVPQSPQRVSIRASNWSTTDWIVSVLMLSSPSALCRGCCECEAPVNTHQPAQLQTAADSEMKELHGRGKPVCSWGDDACSLLPEAHLNDAHDQTLRTHREARSLLTAAGVISSAPDVGCAK